MRSLTNAEKVDQFTIAMKQPREVDLIPDQKDQINLRMRLIYEELSELEDEVFELTDSTTPWKTKNNISPEKVLKELCDLLYVTYGFASTFGLKIDSAFNRVHASNMSKLDDNGQPIYREDGKVVKGPNYTPPVLRDLFE